MTNRTTVEDLLILAKTYPLPSTKYRETTCVAAINREGQLRRVYPVPFRFLEGALQFEKWEWVRAETAHARTDHRPESHRIDVDTVQKLGEKVPSDDGWSRRLSIIEPHIFNDFSYLEDRRQQTKETLGFVRPSRLLSLDITPEKDLDWTASELQKLTQERLFEDTSRKPPTLQKLGHIFHYNYECSTPDGVRQYRHMITDWEAGALYINCRRKYGPE